MLKLVAMSEMFTETVSEQHASNLALQCNSGQCNSAHTRKLWYYRERIRPDINKPYRFLVNMSMTCLKKSRTSIWQTGLVKNSLVKNIKARLATTIFSMQGQSRAGQKTTTDHTTECASLTRFIKWKVNIPRRRGRHESQVDSINEVGGDTVATKFQIAQARPFNTGRIQEFFSKKLQVIVHFCTWRRVGHWNLQPTPIKHMNQKKYSGFSRLYL